MKIYIDLKNQSILTQKSVYGKPFYIGSEYTDVVRLYFNEMPNNWNPTLTYKLANGRTVGPVYPDEGPHPEADEDGSWYYYEFVVSTENKILAVAGQLTITINVNYTNDVGLTIKRATIGNVINQVVATANYGNEKNIVIYGEDDINQLVFDYKNEIEKLGNQVVGLSNDYRTFDLGELADDPSTTNNSTLNAINTKGVYKFTYSKNGYLILATADSNSTLQIIFQTGGVNTINYFTRSMVNNIWTISQKMTIASTSQVDTLAKNVQDNYLTKLIDAFESNTFLEQINVNGKASVVDALNLINQVITMIFNFIEDSFTGDGIAKKAKADQHGNVIDETYATIEKTNNLDASIASTNKKITDLENEHSGINSRIDNIDEIKASKEELQNTKDELIALIEKGSGNVDTSELEAKDAELQSQIDDIKQILASDDVDYDTLQELVNALKNNTASVGDIFTTLAQKQNKINVDSDGDVLVLDAEELTTHYEVTSSSTVGGIRNGDVVSGTIKDVLDMLLGSPISFSISASGGTYEKGFPKKISSITCNIAQGTAKTLDKLYANANNNLIAETTSVVNGSNVLSFDEKTYTDTVSFVVNLVYNSTKTLQKTFAYTYIFRYYYGTTTKDLASLTASDITAMGSKLSTTYSGIAVTMNQSCSVIAVPNTTNYTVYDENGYNVTDNFEKSTLSITNTYGVSTTYTIWKLKTAVTGSKTYRLA